MAESVDALVSNTSGATRAGSTPALGTGFEANVLQVLSSQHFFRLSPKKNAENVASFSKMLYLCSGKKNDYGKTY